MQSWDCLRGTWNHFPYPRAHDHSPSIIQWNLRSFFRHRKPKIGILPQGSWPWFLDERYSGLRGLFSEVDSTSPSCAWSSPNTPQMLSRAVIKWQRSVKCRCLTPRPGMDSFQWLGFSGSRRLSHSPWPPRAWRMQPLGGNEEIWTPPRVWSLPPPTLESPCNQVLSSRLASYPC